MRDEEPQAQPFDSRHLEMSLIAWAITWPERFYEIQDLKTTHFESDGCKTVFSIMQKLYIESGTGAIQTVSMIAKAMANNGWKEDDAFTFLTELNDYTPNGPEAHTTIREQIVKATLQRALSMASYQLSEVAKAGDISSEDLAEKATAVIFDAVAAGSTPKIADMGDEMNLEAERMACEDEGVIAQRRGFSTGLSALDHIISGFHGGEMYILASRPTMGKSALLGTFVHSMLNNGLPGLVVSMEMRREEYAMRMICHTAGVDLHSARNRFLSKNDREAYIRHAKQWAKIPWYLFDQGAPTIGQVSAMTRRLFHEAGIKWIALDYLQLMEHVKSRGETENTAIARTSKGIKALALSLDMPVIALAQLNRDCENRPDSRPRLSDLRDSGSLEQDADVVMFIYREWMYFTQEEKDGAKHDLFEKAEIIVAKQRNGPIGTATVAYYRKSARYADMP